MTTWEEDLDQNIYMLTIHDCQGVAWQAVLYQHGTGWAVGVNNYRYAPSVPVCGRTLNEIKADAESWLMEQGYEILEARHVG